MQPQIIIYTDLTERDAAKKCELHVSLEHFFNMLNQFYVFNSLSASLLLNIFLSFEVGIAHAIANFK